MTTANRARSIRRRRSRMEGKKLPWRSLGIFRSTSPALVESSRSRVPLRWVVRVLRPLEALGADLGGGLGVDQGLEHELHAPAHDVDVAAGADGSRAVRSGHYW